MKRTKMDNSFKLNGISLAIITALSLFSVSSFAAEKAVDKAPTKEGLSEIRMQIQQEKLQQELESERLKKLRMKAEQVKVEDEINGVSTTSVNGEANMPQITQPTEEERISTQNGISQPVGFIYTKDEVTTTAPSKKKSNNILDALTGKESNNEAEPEGADELSKVLQKFDQMKKETDKPAALKVDYVMTKTLVETQLDMLSIFGEDKSAKIKFVYLTDDGIQKKRVANIVNVKEGRVFNVEDDTFKVDKIDGDGLVLVNMKTKEEKIITKNN
jgi:hypothetical protein